MNWLEKGKIYTAKNGNKGFFNGKWLSSADGIKFVLEDEKGRIAGYIHKKNKGVGEMGNKKISELKNEYNLCTGDYGECVCDYKEGYIDEIFSEIADNNVDIYWSDLCEWAKGNSSYIDDYVVEFGIDEKNFDFFRLIQGGQYLCNLEELNENRDDIIKLFILNYIENRLEIKEINEDIENQLVDMLSNVSNYDDLSVIIDDITSIFEEEE